MTQNLPQSTALHEAIEKMTEDWLFGCRLEEERLIVELVPSEENDYARQYLSISFERTIRVPDNYESAELPPSLGNYPYLWSFPLFRVRDYAANFSPTIANKGGIFFPMYQREAMWINFYAETPFIIKIYAGGVNVVSGEHYEENAETKNRRRELISTKKRIQDYIEALNQSWLDGCCIAPGVVRQFVAMPLGMGYSVEAQLTGQEVVRGLQFEITPSIPVKSTDIPTSAERYPLPVGIPPTTIPPPTKPGGLVIIVKSLIGSYYPIQCLPTDRVDDVKMMVENQDGIHTETQQLIWGGRQLEDGRTLSEYNITHGDILHMMLRLRGGGGYIEPSMPMAAGRIIDQVVYKDNYDPSIWARDSTITIPVHILATDTFREVTGRSAPPCFISASTYASVNLPFFDLPEEPSAISGDFDKVKSVNTIDVERGIAAGEEPNVKPRVVTLPRFVKDRANLAVFEDPDELVSPDGPLRDFRTLKDLHDETANEGGDYL